MVAGDDRPLAAAKRLAQTLEEGPRRVEGDAEREVAQLGHVAEQDDAVGAGDLRQQQLARTLPEDLHDRPAAARPLLAQLGSDPAGFAANEVGLLMTDRTWLWAASESLHVIGMWLLVGIVLFVNLRMLGLFRSWSFASVHRLLPWAALGFAVNTITGMGFITAAPQMYAENISFLWKIGFLMLAGVNLLYATVFEGPWHVESGEDAPLRVKVMGASAILSWLGVMYFGRMLPFIGEAF